MKRPNQIILITVCLLSALFLNVCQAIADDTNEDQLFSGDTMVSQDSVVNNNTGDELKENHIGFSGEINTKTQGVNYLSGYDWTKSVMEDVGLYSVPDELSNQVNANFFMDIRLKKGVKGFLSLGVDYYPEGRDEINYVTLSDKTSLSFISKKTMDIGIKEAFIDANWKNKVYFRTGKQVLKWGQGYFWNPTDLINIEKKDFLDMNKIRKGTFGTKIHIPSGVKTNTYFFVGMNQVKKLNDISLAAKYEFLVKNTEMSLSTLIKNGSKPMYGCDITGRLFGLDYHGELSLTDGEKETVLDYNTLSPNQKTGEIIPKVCIGATKFFDYGEIKDRINLTGELYYNQVGYDYNVIQRIETINPAAKALYLANYEPYRNSKCYFAVFSSISKFMISDITFNFNGIMNLVDNSSALTAGISYNPALTDIVVDFNITGPLGDPYTETNISGKRLIVSLGTKISF